MTTDIEHCLRTSEVAVLGRMPWSSNATFLVELLDPEEPDASPSEELGTGLKAIYKPRRGERPLWDFPGGLYRREVAAFELARSLAWDCVPITIERDGPIGVGSFQRFVVADFEQHYFTLYEDESFHQQLRRMCAFDIVANSADRKSGHVLADAERHLWGIDNGLCFHEEMKLRTVMWEFAGEPLPSDLADDLCGLAERGLSPALCELLDRPEQDAVLARARRLVTDGCFPSDPTGRRYPWPLV